MPRNALVTGDASVASCCGRRVTYSPSLFRTPFVVSSEGSVHIRPFGPGGAALNYRTAQTAGRFPRRRGTFHRRYIRDDLRLRSQPLCNRTALRNR